MKDKCGREITVGCVVDLHVNGIVSAFVVEVKNGGLIGQDGRPEPAVLVCNITVPLKFRPGQPANCYVVQLSEQPVAEEPEEKVH